MRHQQQRPKLDTSWLYNYCNCQVKTSLTQNNTTPHPTPTHPATPHHHTPPHHTTPHQHTTPHHTTPHATTHVMPHMTPPHHTTPLLYNKWIDRKIAAGANVMLMNGLPVDVPSLELYPLLDRISAEVSLTAQFSMVTNASSSVDVVRGGPLPWRMAHDLTMASQTCMTDTL